MERKERKCRMINGDNKKKWPLSISEIIVLFLLIWASLSIFEGRFLIPMEYVFQGIADPDRTILDYFMDGL